MFTTIKARFPAVCKRCSGEIPLGATMRYGGRGRTYHLKERCPAVNGGGASVAADDDARALAEAHRTEPIISNLSEQHAREAANGS